MNESSDTAHVTTTGAKHLNPNVEFDELSHATAVKIDSDGVVNLNMRIGVADCAPVVGDNVRDGVFANSSLLDFAELELLKNQKIMSTRGE